jgi:glutaredoxin-related protein
MHNTNLNLLSKSVDFSHWETVPAEYINNPLIIETFMSILATTDD